jgi:hypothetical protein
MSADTTPATVWRFEMPGWPPGPNERLHGVARWRLSAPYRDGIAWQCLAARPAVPLPRAAVRITLVRTGGRALDPDNLVAATKPLIDGLTVGRLIVDDSDRHIRLEVRQAVGHKRTCLVEVWPLDGGPDSGREEIADRSSDR